MLFMAIRQLMKRQKGVRGYSVFPRSGKQSGEIMEFHFWSGKSENVTKSQGIGS